MVFTIYQAPCNIQHILFVSSVFFIQTIIIYLWVVIYILHRISCILWFPNNVWRYKILTFELNHIKCRVYDLIWKSNKKLKLIEPNQMLNGRDKWHLFRYKYRVFNGLKSILKLILIYTYIYLLFYNK